MNKFIKIVLIFCAFFFIYLSALHFKVQLRIDDGIMKHNIVNISDDSKDLICNDGNTSYFIVSRELANDLLNGNYIYELAYKYKEKEGGAGLLNTISLCMVLEGGD